MTYRLIVAQLLSCVVLAASVRATDDAMTHFEKEIRPVLATRCVQCHGAKKQEGGLRLDSLQAMLAGGDSGPAIDMDDPTESLLMEALNYESYEMPPDEQLPQTTIRQFAKWLDAGAKWPDHVGPLRDEAHEVSDSDRQWWAFQPVQHPHPPQLQEDSWCSNEIDHFVLQRLRDQVMRPAPEADRETLIRRLYFDLIGLPPTPKEIDAFVRDTNANAWEAVVDRLLADERYGEHWARYWLDIVRYSESDGWNQDAYRPDIWRYRDYVVNAFNNDKPYPQFVREQLAGDEIDSDNPEHLVATGFLRLGIYEYNQRDARGHWNDIMNEMTDVTGDVFLGMSMACARCHNHKFDPLPQQDYFRLRAFFEPIVWRDDLVAATQDEKREYERQLDKWNSATAEIQAKIDALLAPYYDKKWKSTVDKFPLDIQACFHMPVEERTSWQHQMAYLVSRQFMEEGGGPLKAMSKEDVAKHEALKKELAAFDDIKPTPLPTLMAATDFSGMLSPTFVQDDPDRAPVSPGFLSVMSHLPLGSSAVAHVSVPSSTHLATTAIHSTTDVASELNTIATLRPGTSGRRTRLAEWIGDAGNPLTTRVIVNRIWQQHFGEGLVATPNDFGTQGALPSHPELLDWLAATFVDQDGWSLKKLHKRIVMSSTWRQSASHPEAGEYQAKDPAEKLLWRWRVKRLQAEQIRDAMLAASGELLTDVGGPSVEEDTPRRSLYVKSFRNKYDTFLHGFDMANGLKSVPIRDTTTTPLQALLLINGQYALQRSEIMAHRLIQLELEPTETVSRCFQYTWGRRPNQQEMNKALDFLHAASGEDAGPLDSGRLSDFCHVLLNSNPYLYVR
ncbi:MAG: PSD1 and planctomycete cytochrome C domain-containing protein [bacterium]|nr:PSD1 and planctomycete cytochrome C domain-containing protein [bacterium]